MEQKEMIEFFVQIAIQIIILIISFFFGRYSTYKSDCRNAIKELNENFFKPFISIYENEHHACALRIVDLSIDAQKQMMKLLLDNRVNLSPRLQNKIMIFDVMFSGYIQSLENKQELLDEEMEEIEQHFSKIYIAVEKQYKKNSRKIYCTLSKRIWYCICDAFYYTKTITSYYISVFKNKKRKNK